MLFFFFFKYFDFLCFFSVLLGFFVFGFFYFFFFLIYLYMCVYAAMAEMFPQNICIVLLASEECRNVNDCLLLLLL